MPSTKQQHIIATPSDIGRDLTPRDLHKYVWTLIGVWILFLATFPLACWRVARNEKFGDLPLNSIDRSENQKANLTYPTKK